MMEYISFASGLHMIAGNCFTISGILRIDLSSSIQTITSASIFQIVPPRAKDVFIWSPAIIQ